LLTFSAILEKNIFFSLFQAITLCSVIFSFISLALIVKLIVLTILAIIIIIALKRLKQLETLYVYFGVIGLVCLSFAYATSNGYGYLFGGLFITIFSLISFLKGFKIGFIYFVLNLIYTIVAIIPYIK
jgi:hypothetical protein